jgi:general secretion pathway protein K
MQLRRRYCRGCFQHSARALRLPRSKPTALSAGARTRGWKVRPRARNLLSIRTAGLAYAPREAPFAHVGKLWLVLGIPSQLIERALPFVTVFSGRAEINVLGAAPLVPGMTLERLNAILNLRATSQQDGKLVLDALGPARHGATIEGSKATRVRASVNFDNGRKSTAIVVILALEDGDDPYRVLSWRDESDGPIADELRRTDLR